MWRRYKYFFISIGIMIAWMALGFLLVYPSGRKLGNAFGLSVFYIFTRQVSLFGGLVVLLIRLMRIIKPTHLVYILAGTLNAGVGITAVIFFFSGLTNMQWLSIALYNLLLSLIFFTDSFFLTSNPRPHKE